MFKFKILRSRAPDIVQLPTTTGNVWETKQQFRVGLRLGFDGVWPGDMNMGAIKDWMRHELERAMLGLGEDDERVDGAPSIDASVLSGASEEK